MITAEQVKCRTGNAERVADLANALIDAPDVRSQDPIQVWEAHPVVSLYLDLRDREIAEAIDLANAAKQARVAKWGGSRSGAGRPQTDRTKVVTLKVSERAKTVLVKTPNKSQMVDSLLVRQGAMLGLPYTMAEYLHLLEVSLLGTEATPRDAEVKELHKLAMRGDGWEAADDLGHEAHKAFRRKHFPDGNDFPSLYSNWWQEAAPKTERISYVGTGYAGCGEPD